MTRLLSKKPDTDLASYVPTLAQLGSVIGTSGRWIAELRARGAIPGNGATLAQSIQAWGAHLSATAPGVAGGGDLEAERTRLTAAQAEQVERRNARERGELVPLPNISDAVSQLFELTRTNFERLGVTIAGTDHKLRARIDLAVADALEALTTVNIIEVTAGNVAPDRGGEDYDGE